ncbi:MAG: zinc transporter ZntB [Alphaproteobacteria bacterium]|nr:MAG: zinc transporter ZntB [Alphaproteobacteria bacterium]
MQDTAHIFHCMELTGEGSWQQVDLAEVSGEFAPRQLTWIHLDYASPATRIWIERNLSFLDPEIQDALLSEAPRPRIEEYEDGLILMLRAANLNEGQDPEDMISVRMWVDPMRIVTVQRRRVRAIEDVQERLATARAPKTVGSFIIALVRAIIDRMEGVISDLDEETDALEEEVLAEASVEVRERIVHARQRAIVFRRYIVPQRDALMQLRAYDSALFRSQERFGLQAVLDDLQRFVEELDAIRERAMVIKDEFANILSDRLNKRLYMLAIVTTIFLPLSFLTGLLGVNLGGIPGADSAVGFASLCAIVVVAMIVQIFWFKWKRWF